MWYVRHGESESNVRGVFADGNDDQPLTAKGRDQARRVGELLKDKDIDAIIASPLSRTLDTAMIIANAIGFSPNKIKTDRRFIEYLMASGNGAPYEGMTAKQIISFEGAEDPQAFADRIKQGVRAAREAGENILVVAHGGVGKMINCLQSSGDPKDFYDFPKLSNADLSLLNLEWLK